MSFRFAVIGCGEQAKVAYLDPIRRYLKAHPDAALAGCCDVSAEKARAFAGAAGGAKAYQDFQQMIYGERPDAVLLLTPFAVTADLAVPLLLQGIPTLIEKPPGNHTKDAQRIADAYRHSGTLHQIAFNRRHMPLIRLLREKVGEQPIRHIELRMHRVRRMENHFHTTAIHGIDLVNFLADSPVSLMHALYQPLTPDGAVANMQMLQAYQNGVTAQLSFCPMSGLVCEQVALATDHSSFFVDLPVWGARGNLGSLCQYTEGALVFETTGDIEGADMVDSNGFTAQLFSFFADIRAGRQPRDAIGTGLDAMRLADCLAGRAAAYAPPAGTEGSEASL